MTVTGCSAAPRQRPPPEPLLGLVQGAQHPPKAGVVRPLARRHLIPELGHVRLKDLKPEQVRRHYRKKLDSGLSNRTVQLIHTTLRKALQQAVSDSILPRNVCEAVKAPRKVKREMRILTPEQVRKFLEAVKGGSCDKPAYSLIRPLVY